MPVLWSVFQSCSIFFFNVTIWSKWNLSPPPQHRAAQPQQGPVPSKLRMIGSCADKNCHNLNSIIGLEMHLARWRGLVTVHFRILPKVDPIGFCDVSHKIRVLTRLCLLELQKHWLLWMDPILCCEKPSTNLHFTALKIIHLPPNLKRIGPTMTFDKCKALVSIVIPALVEGIHGKSSFLRVL